MTTVLTEPVITLTADHPTHPNLAVRGLGGFPAAAGPTEMKGRAVTEPEHTETVSVEGDETNERPSDDEQAGADAAAENSTE